MSPLRHFSTSGQPDETPPPAGSAPVPPVPPTPAVTPAPPPLPSAADARASRLELELRLAREQAVTAMTMLREREEAQKSAQAEMEKLLRVISEQKRGEEYDRQMRDQIASQKKRIDDLEAMLIASRHPEADAALLRRIAELEAKVTGAPDSIAGWEKRFASLVSEFEKFHAATDLRMREAQKAQQAQEDWRENAAHSMEKEARERIAQMNDFMAAAQRVEESETRRREEAWTRMEMEFRALFAEFSESAGQAEATRREEARARLETEFKRFDALFVEHALRAEQIGKALTSDQTDALRRDSAEQVARLRSEMVRLRDELLGSLSEAAGAAHRAEQIQTRKQEEARTAVENEILRFDAFLTDFARRVEQTEAQRQEETRARIAAEFRRFETLFADFGRNVERTEAARVEKEGAAVRRELLDEAARLRAEMTVAAADARKAFELVQTDTAKELLGFGARVAEFASALEGPSGPAALAKTLDAVQSALKESSKAQVESLREEVLGRLEAESRERDALVLDASRRVDAESRERQAAIADAFRRADEDRRAALAQAARDARESEDAVRRDMAVVRSAVDARERAAAAKFTEVDERLRHAEDQAALSQSTAEGLEALRKSVETMGKLPGVMRDELAAAKASIEKELRESLGGYLVKLEEGLRSLKR
jgi:uncharacterized protein YdcH (DUF465 family)